MSAPDGPTLPDPLQHWLLEAAAVLAVPGEVHNALLLDLAREVAHGVARPAAPLTTYLLGVAVGRGADPQEAAGRLVSLLQERPKTDPG